MAVDLDAVDLLHVVGEELGDVLVGRPVDRHAELVAVFGLELLLEVGSLEPVVAEPVQVRELLVGQLVELAVRARCVNDLPMKSSTSSVGRVTSLPSPAIQSVSGDGLLVAEMGADQVGVVDLGVVDVLAGLHLGLDLLDDVAFLDQVVGDLDAGDLA